MSTEQAIKQQLLQGKVLTSCRAAQLFQTADLRKYISNLRKAGMDIRDEVFVTPYGKWFKKYWYGGGSKGEA